MSERILKISASAGSGKTFRLTMEYLLRIFNKKNLKGNLDEIISDIYAITFTNKASNEMKSRILNALIEFSLFNKEKIKVSGNYKILEEIVKKTGLDFNEIKQISDKLINTIIINYSDFNIKTIDSLMSSIIKVISADLDFEPDFEIKISIDRDMKNLLKMYLVKKIDEGNNFEKNLIENMRFFLTDSFSPEYVILDKSSDIFKKMQSYKFDPIDKDEIFKRINQLNSLLIKELRVINDFIEKYEANGLNRGLLRGNPALKVKIKQYIENGRFSFNDLKSFSLKSFFLKNDLYEAFKNDKVPEVISENYLESFKKIKEYLSEIFLKYSAGRIAFITNFLKDFKEFWEEEKEYLYVKEFNSKLKDKLSEWKEYALPYIYLKLSDRFKHFLIDEFQDTSRSQLEALSPLIDEMLSSEINSSLFIVGDKKQAIYRWRGGDAELMDNENLINMIPSINNIEEKNLDVVLRKNFRSSKEIIEFNNLFWDSENIRNMINSDNDEYKDKISNNFSDSFQEIEEYNREISGYVQFNVNEFEKKSGINIDDFRWNNVYEFIKKAKDSGFDYSDIAVLVRKRKHGLNLIEFLSKKGIQCYSDDSLLINSNFLVREIVNFLKFVEYPDDDLSLYTFLKGEIFNKILEVEKINLDIDSYIIKKNNGHFLYQILRENYKNLWDKYFSYFFKSSGFLKPYDLINDVLMVFGVLDRFNNHMLFIKSFLDFVLKAEKNGISNLNAFLEYFDELDNADKNEFPSIRIPDSFNSVKVLTLHKSKGLEFPVVIIPLIDDRNDYDSFFVNDNEMYYITQDIIKINKKLKEIYDKEKLNGYIDSLNLLYVGFTRAKNLLFIDYSFEKSNNNSSSDSLKFKYKELLNHEIFRNINSELKESLKLTKYVNGTMHDNKNIKKKEVKSKEKSINNNKILVNDKSVSTLNWKRDFLVFKTSNFNNIQEIENTKRGILIHEFFRRINKLNSIEDINDYLKNYEFIDEYDYERIRNFLNNEEILQYFTANEFDVYNEFEIIDNENEFCRYRIDRLLMNNNKIIVIDYKTGNEKKDEHIEQVRNYMKILKRIYKEKNINGVLLYIDLIEKKEVKID